LLIPAKELLAIIDASHSTNSLALPFAEIVLELEKQFSEEK